MTISSRQKTKLIFLLLISVGGTLAVPTNTTTPKTNITTATASTNSTKPLIDRRCYWDDAGVSVGHWDCPRKGFKCINLVCIDTRIPDQKEADMQEDAEGKNGRCLFTYETGNYTCAQRGFECQDQTLCVDRRTPEEKAEDNKIHAAKAKTAKLAGAIVGGIIGAGVLLSRMICCCRAIPRNRREHVNADNLRRAVEMEIQKMRAAVATDAAQPPPTYRSV